MKDYPSDVQQMINHYLFKFDGRIQLSADEAAKILNRTANSLAVDRCKRRGPLYYKQGKKITYSLYALADHLMAGRVHIGQNREI